MSNRVFLPLSTRRQFIRRLALGPAVLAGVAHAVGETKRTRRVRFGLIADIHPDVMPDGIERVRAFVAAMQRAQVDFILQLGDFCWPAPRNQPFLEAWNQFRGPRFHVLGNHDIQINSASYWWLNNPAARRETSPSEVHKAYPYLTHVAAYREPLWALVTLDLDRGELAIKGRRTQWVGPDPWARGEQAPWPREQLHPAVSTRRPRLCL